MNLKVYDVIDCLNKNLEKEKDMTLKLQSVDRVLNKKHFYGKIMQKMCSKTSPRPL